MKLPILRRLPRQWPTYLLAGGAVIVLIGLYLWRLDRPPALSSVELQAQLAASSWRHIWRDPLNAPFSVLDHAITKFFPHRIGPVRFGSVLLTAGMLAVFYWVLVHFFNRTAALFGLILFTCSGWLLHVGRLASPDILQAGSVLMLAVGLWLRHTGRRLLPIICGVILSALACYVPGLIWFVIIVLVWQWRDWKVELQGMKWYFSLIGAMAFLILLVPLIISFIHQPTSILTVLGLPDTWKAFTQVPLQLLRLPQNLFWYGPSDPVRWLPHLPLLNVFEDVLLVLGLNSFWQHRQLERSQAVAAVLAVAIILIALGGETNMTLLMPVLYIIITGGFVYLLELWLSVFPNNPIARSFGTVLLSLVIALSVAYNLRSYFVAWPNAPATRAAFTIPPSAIPGRLL